MMGSVACLVFFVWLLILQLFYEMQTQRVHPSSVINTGIKLQSIKWWHQRSWIHNVHAHTRTRMHAMRGSAFRLESGLYLCHPHHSTSLFLFVSYDSCRALWMEMSLGAPLCSRLKCLQNYWIDAQCIKHGCSLHDITHRFLKSHCGGLCGHSSRLGSA